MTGHLKIAKILVFLSFSSSMIGCANSEASYDSGYSDGYAVGYNTTCQIRATMIEGNWDSAEYSRGYADGQTAGTIACNNERRSSE